jgi:predicted RNA-binding Zn ribbon-like protein
MSSYEGPVRGEPLPIELHNTLYADRGRVADGLADASGLRAWLAALGDRLPVAARSVDAGRLDDFVALRAAVREALHAAQQGRAIPEGSRAALNRASARNPQSLQLSWRGSETRHHGPAATEVVLGVIAADTIALVSEQRDMRACGAPGCVLMFIKDHPRREWCSTACGNRARQARHYARRRAAAGGRGG